MFATEQAEELFKGRWQALQLELRSIYGDTWDRDLSQLIRTRFRLTLPGMEISAKSLNTVEHTWRSFKRRMSRPKQRQLDLWECTTHLHWRNFTRLRVLARAAVEELQAALSPLDVDLVRAERRSAPKKRSDLWTDSVWAPTDNNQSGTLRVWVASAKVLPSPSDERVRVRLPWYRLARELGSNSLDEVGLAEVEAECNARPRRVIVKSGKAKTKSIVTDVTH